MQDRYTGDIGDYVKLSILRRVGIGRRLGVLWWLYPDESHNADGKHVAYLSNPIKWRRRDPLLFDGLKGLVDGGRRTVADIETANLLPDAIFFREPVPTAGSARDRRSGRVAWFGAALDSVAACDLVFLDPDNGLETSRYEPGGAKAGKSVSLAEIEALRRPDRTIIVYHHQTRMAGGHLAELSYWGKRLAERGFAVDALRASAFSARAFFLLDAPDDLRMRARDLTHDWAGKLTWHPNLG